MIPVSGEPLAIAVETSSGVFDEVMVVSPIPSAP